MNGIPVLSTKVFECKYLERLEKAVNQYLVKVAEEGKMVVTVQYQVLPHHKETPYTAMVVAQTLAHNEEGSDENN